MQRKCKTCLYHLPDAEDHVCVEEESPRYGEITIDDDCCDCFKERKYGVE